MRDTKAARTALELGRWNAKGLVLKIKPRRELFSPDGNYSADPYEAQMVALDARLESKKDETK